MLSEIKLVVRQKDKVVKTIVKETNAEPTHLVKSLEEFQQIVNNALTHLIESSNNTGADIMVVEGEEESEDDVDKDISNTPKRKRKRLGMLL